MSLQMSAIQQKLLEIIKWFHEFCNENKLKYYMIGGTMLGAVRHKGFIPWDDDIDVGMSRKDYEHFLDLTEGKIIDHYTVESFHSGHIDYVYPFAKIYDTETTLVDKKRIPVIRGVFVDVFPLDGVGSGKNYSAAYNKFRKEKNMLSALTAEIDKKYGMKKNLVFLIMRGIPGYKNKIKQLQTSIDSFCRTVPFEDSLIVANLVGSRKEKEYMPREYFGEPVLYEFENIQLYGVENPDAYLTHLIGDYMTLPPEDQREGHLTDQCSLEQGYLTK